METLPGTPFVAGEAIKLGDFAPSWLGPCGLLPAHG